MVSASQPQASVAGSPDMQRHAQQRCRLLRRDLKPENILLNANGHALLTDFDLSYCSKGTYPELIKKTPPRKVRAGNPDLTRPPSISFSERDTLRQRRMIAGSGFLAFEPSSSASTMSG